MRAAGGAGAIALSGFPATGYGDRQKARSSQKNPALDFLAELTQHVPNKGEHLVRYYGWYSHRQRGIGAKNLPSPSGRGAGGEGCATVDLVIDRSVVDAVKSAAGGARDWFGFHLGHADQAGVRG